MSVPTNIDQLSQTATANSPQPTDPVGTNANQFFQAAYAFIAFLRSNAMRVDGTNSPSTNLPMGGYRLTGLGDPVNPQDAATMHWVQTYLSGSTGAAQIGFNGTTLDQFFKNNTAFEANSVAQMCGLNPAVFTRADTSAYTYGTPVGGARYTYNPSGLAANANGGTILASTYGTNPVGTWEMFYPGNPSTAGGTTFEHWGAFGDGVTDDTAALLNATNHGCFKGIIGKTYKTTNYSWLIANAWQLQGGGTILYNGTYLPIGPINNNLVLNVPSVFQSIADAIAWLETKFFDQNGYAQIKVANGTYACPEIAPQWAQGERIQILGDQSGHNPPQVTLTFNTSGNNSCGFKFFNGYQCDYIDGFYLQGNGNTATGVWANQSYGAGILAINAGRCRLGPNMQVNQHYYGVQARYSGTIEIPSGGVQVFKAGDCGFHAFANGSINANNCKAFQCQDTTNTSVAILGFGFCAEAGGVIDCSGSNTANNYVNGFYALSNGAMWAHNCEANNNGSAGFAALEGGMIEANSGNSYNNATGYYCWNGAIMNCNSALATTNTGDGFAADDGSRMDITASSSTHNGGVGYHVMSGSVMEGSPANAYANSGVGVYVSNGSVFNSANATINNNGGGVFATQNAQALINSASINNNGNHGVFAQDNSSIFGNNIVSNGSTNGGHGFYVSTNSTFRGSSPSANNNAGWGFYAENNAFMQATSGGGVGNSAGFASPPQTASAAANLGAWIRM